MRVIASGVLLQSLFAIFILRVPFGYGLFDWLGARVQEFLKYTDAGSELVFGDKDKYRDHQFAMAVRITNGFKCFFLNYQ